MARPLQILAICALGIGFLVGPPTHWFANLIEHTPGLPHNEIHENAVMVMILGSLAAIGGISLAFVFYVARPALPDQVARRAGKLVDYSYNKFYIDEIYVALIVRPLRVLAFLAQTFDRLVVDRTVDLVGTVPGRVGQWFRPMQAGNVQSYALVMAVGLTVFVVSMALAF
jgi:NADH-quinone oxidoreductase subunit L